MSLQMIRSRVFVFLSITLCLVTCCCANAEAGDGATKQEAEQAVIDLKKLTEKVFGRAQTKSRDAEGVKADVESQKAKAESAESDAKAAAEAITAENRKTEVKGIAEKAKGELENCLKLYQDAKDKADQASNSLKEFLTRANKLVKNASSEIPLAPGQTNNYAQVIANAEAVTADTQALRGEIGAAETLLNTADIALSTLKGSAQKVQILKYQANAIAIVSQIETMLNTAEADIQSIGQKKDEINATVQAMNTIFESASVASIGYLNSLCGKAENQLETASKKLKEAQKCNEDMQGKKTQVDGTLSTLKARTDESEAGRDLETVKWRAKSIDEDFQKIKQALRTAETSVSSAKSQHQQMLNYMSQNNRQSGSEPEKDNQQADVPTPEVPTVIQNAKPEKSATTTTKEPTVIKNDGPAITTTEKSELTDTNKPEITETEKTVVDKPAKQAIPNTENPVITETEKPIFGKSENSMDKASDQPVDANLDNTETPESTQLMHEEEQSPRDDNSELLNNDKLRNITKNITKNPLIDEVPKWSAANDSAVTVSIPLLVALIVSAVFH